MTEPMQPGGEPEVIIHAHKDEWQAARFHHCGNIAWRPASEPIPQGHAPQRWRSCSYCGSMHPYDLLAYIKAGAQVTGSDWKYDWPHKFYVKVPNPEPNVEYIASSHYEHGKPESHTYDTRQHLHGKWYNQHLLDVPVPVELFELLAEHTRIRFRVLQGPPRQLQYGAPHAGYQRSGYPQYDDPLPPIPKLKD